MFEDMSFDQLTTDELEQQLVASQQIQSGLKARDLEVLEELDRRQVATGDGCKSLSEWVAARLDLSLDSAKRLVRTMRRTAQRPHLRELLASGDVSFDRVEALSRIPDDIGLLQHLDVAGVQVEAAKRVRVTAENEMRNADDQFLVMQPSLDESRWKMWAGFDGYSGALVDKALTEAADALPTLPDGRATPVGGKPTHWWNCVSPTTRRRLRSPCSSTPKTPSTQVVKPGWCWNQDPGWVVRRWRRCSATPPWRSPPGPRMVSRCVTAAVNGPHLPRYAEP